MRRVLLVLLGTALVMGMVCAGLGQGEEGPSGSPNLVPNGGFEIDADGDGMPDQWRLTVGSDDRFITGRLSTRAHSGKYCFCADKPHGSVYSTYLSSSSFDVKPNTAYRVSIWLRMEGTWPTDTIPLRVANTYFHPKVGKSWQKSTFTHRTEDSTSSGHIILYLSSLADRLYIDDIEIRETEVKEEKPRYQKTDLSDFKFPPKHPYVEYTPQEIEQIKESIKDEDSREYKIYATNVKPYGDAWLRRKVHFFDKGWDSKYYSTKRHCPTDHTLLRSVVKPDGTCEMKCPQCGKVYRDEGYQAVARAEYNTRMSGGVLSLGKAYALTGDERYASRVREILLGIAGCFQQWGGAGHATLYHLREANYFLYPCAAGYDYVYDSPSFSAEDHRKIEDDFLRPAGEYFCRYADGNGRMNNRGAIYHRAVMAVALALKDKGLLDHVLNSPYSGFHALVAGMFDEDGLSKEGLGYHEYSMCGLSPIAEMAYRVGINLYGDPAYRKLFDAPLSVLLPGEKMMVEQFALACPRFAELGRPMAFPFSKEDLEHALRFSLRPLPTLGKDAAIPISSYNFSHIGYGVLRSGQGEDEKYLSITYGKEAMFMGHAPGLKFGLVFYANGGLLTPKGAAGYGDALCGAWSRNPLPHNTITADDTDQLGRTEGRLTAFEIAPQVKLMRAMDDEAYPGITLDRTLFLTDRYMVDLCGAHADQGLHRYDLCYRNLGELSCPLKFENRKGPLGVGFGYQYLTDVKSAHTTKTWAADWRQTEESAVKVSVLGEPGTEVISCTSPSNASEEEQVAAILARRWAQGTVFASVWEPYRQEPSITSISSLAVKQGGRRVSDSQAVGIKVTTEGGKVADYFLASYSPGPKSYGDTTLDGLAASGRWAGGKSEPNYLHLVQGISLRRGSNSIGANVPATIYLERLSDNQLILKTGADTSGTLTMEGKVLSGVAVKADGKQVEAKIEGTKALTFQVIPGTSYQISGLAGWTSVRLKGEAQGVTGKEVEAQEPATIEPAIEQQPTVKAPLEADGSLIGKNKVANASFEINYKTHFEIACPAREGPWKFQNSYYWADFRPVYDYTSESAHSGKYSIRIGKVGWANESTQDAWVEQKVCDRGSEKTYTLSAWVKASVDPTRVRLCIHGFNPKWGNDYEGGVSPWFDIGTQWQRISWTRTLGLGIAQVYVMVKREHQILGGDLWIDAVQLEQGSGATDFVPDAWTQTVQREMPEKPEPNLVANGGFEEGDQGWQGVGGYCTLETADPRSGKQCLKIHTGDAKKCGEVFSQPIEIVQGARYLVEFWVKVKDITESGYDRGGRVMLSVDRGGKADPRWWSPQIYRDFYTGTQGWRKVEKLIWAQAGGTAQLRLDLRHSTGTIWFDDILVTMISPPGGEK